MAWRLMPADGSSSGNSGAVGGETVAADEEERQESL